MNAPGGLPVNQGDSHIQDSALPSSNNGIHSFYARRVLWGFQASSISYVQSPLNCPHFTDEETDKNSLLL